MGSFFGNAEVVLALGAGSAAAVLCALIGVFVVLRHQSFAGHAVTDIGFTGGAGAPLIHVNRLWGLLAFSIVGALSIGRLGARVGERDVVTGVVLTIALALGSLFMFVQTQYVSQPASLLFGSIFAIDTQTLRSAIVLSLGAIAGLVAIYRPLLFATISPEAAGARGVPVRLLTMGFLVLMAVAVSEAAQIVGVLLTTALLIGPAAAAMQLSRRMPVVLLLAVAIGVGETIAGIGLAYASYYWPPGGKGWPASFFISILALLIFLGARSAAGNRHATHAETAG